MNDTVKRDLEEIAANLGSLAREFEGRRVLLTGGAGFLGYYLVQFFLYVNDTLFERPSKVLCVDNFLRGLPGWLEALEGRGDLEVFRADITGFDFSLLGTVDYIMHAASVASPTYYRLHPIETMDANVVGLRRLLDYCLAMVKSGEGIKSLLFFSSSEIYGDPPGEAIPTPESYRGSVSCTGPRACYDESKRFGETLCVNFHRVHRVPVKIVRPFNNYGPGLRIDDRRVIPDFARNVLRGEDIVLLSDGSPTRTFCYVTDAMTGYLLTLLSGHNGEAFNIGVESPEVSIKELAELVIKTGEEVLGTRGLRLVCGRSEDREYLTDNPGRRCPSIRKAKELLGYSPRVGLEEGLKRSLLWYAACNREEKLTK